MCSSRYSLIFKHLCSPPNVLKPCLTIPGALFHHYLLQSGNICQPYAHNQKKILRPRGGVHALFCDSFRKWRQAHWWTLLEVDVALFFLKWHELWWTFRKWRHALCCSEQTSKMELFRGVSSLNCYVWYYHRLKATGQLIKDLNFQIVSHPLQNHPFPL